MTAQVDDLLLSATEGRGTQRSLDIPGPPAKSLTVTAAPLDDKWRTVGGVLVLGDQSEQQRQEGVRRDFVANISHELKTPVGALALLAETLSTEHDLVVVNRLARRVQVEAKRVERVVDDLIDLSRLQSEEDPVRERVAVHLIVAQAAERVRHLAQDKEMTINFGEPPQRLWVMGDRRQLVAAVYNLLENAVKFSPAGSLVEVRGRPGKDDDTGEADGMVEISVRDEGIGIPERDHDRIFERFYRVESTRSATAGGTGLGLSIVRHVVANHDGSVEVDSEEGLGATFTLRLPVGSRRRAGGGPAARRGGRQGAAHLQLTGPTAPTMAAVAGNSGNDSGKGWEPLHKPARRAAGWCRSRNRRSPGWRWPTCWPWPATPSSPWPWPGRCSSPSRRRRPGAGWPSTCCSPWRPSRWWRPSWAPSSTARPSGRRLILIAGSASRALICLSMANHLQSLWLFPEAFGVLVLSKAHMVTKSALVPMTVPDERELVTANSRLAVLSVLAGFAAAIPGVIILKVGFLGGPWVVRLAAVAFAAAAIACVRIPKPTRVATAAALVLADKELHAISIRMAATSMAVLRAGVGFMTFFVAFAFRARGAPSWWFGVVLVCSLGGTLVGNVAAPSAAAVPGRGAHPARRPGPGGGGGLRRRAHRRAGRLQPGGGGHRRGRGRGQARLRLHRPARRPRRGPGPHLRPLRDPLPAGVGGGRLRPGGRHHLHRHRHRHDRPGQRPRLLQLPRRHQVAPNTARSWRRGDAGGPAGPRPRGRCGPARGRGPPARRAWAAPSPSATAGPGLPRPPAPPPR